MPKCSTPTIINNDPGEPVSLSGKLIAASRLNVGRSRYQIAGAHLGLLNLIRHICRRARDTTAGSGLSQFSIQVLVSKSSPTSSTNTPRLITKRGCGKVCAVLRVLRYTVLGLRIRRGRWRLHLRLWPHAWLATNPKLELNYSCPRTAHTPAAFWQNHHSQLNCTAAMP